MGKRSRSRQQTPAAGGAADGLESPQENFFGSRLALALVLLCALAAVWPALTAGFINWDDPQYITKNPLMAGHGWKEVFTTSPLGYYHPLTVAGYKLVYTLAGPDPVAFHGLNIALHLANCALVYYFALAVSGGPPAALAAALMFAVHPTRAEPVAWISGMKDLLSCLFFLGTLLTYLRYLRSLKERAAGPGWLAASAALFAAALLAKPTILTGALVLFVLDWHQERPLSKRIFVEKLPYFLAAAVPVLLSFKFGKFFLAQYSGFHPLRTAAYAGNTALFYLSKTVYPAKLSSLYPHPHIPGNIALACLPAVVLIAAGAWLLKARLRPYALGAWFFALTLLPSLRFAELFPADRYLYLPAIGLFCAAGAAFAALYKRAKIPAGAAAAALVLALAWNCHARAALWGSAVSLWDDTLSKYQPGPAERNSFFSYVRSYRGISLFEVKRFEEAFEDYSAALKLAPARDDVYELYYWLGNCSFRLQRYEQAAGYFGSSLEHKPDYELARNNHGSALLALGRYAEAEADFGAALELSPQYTDAYINRGRVRLISARFGPAAEDFSRALALRPGSDTAFDLRGRAELGLKRYDAAIADLDRALLLNPDNGTARALKAAAEKLRRL